MGPPWDPSGADRIQVDPMLAPWTLLKIQQFIEENAFESVVYKNVGLASAWMCLTLADEVTAPHIL